MTAVENPRAGQGSVVLDIGVDVGAIVVSAPSELIGAEIEVCPAGRRADPPDEGRGWWPGGWRSSGHAHAHDPAWPHVSVLPRATPAGVRCAAVFPGLRAGRYELWLRPTGPTALVVAVEGARVTEVDWPSGQGA